MNKFIAALLILSLCSANPSGAEPIYRKDPSSGSVMYSSKPIGPNSSIAQLPPVERVQPSITAVATCMKHGGVSCTAGKDSDGSVICLDGARDSIQSYHDHCEQVRLELSEIIELEAGGADLYIRNRTAVVAKSVQIVYLPRLGRIRRFKLGKNIEPFEEVSFRLAVSDIGPGDRRPTLGEIGLECLGCPKIGQP